jgi:glutathione S-transferase
MYESDDIVAYLDATYGGERGWRLPIPGFLNDINSGIASAVRLARGTRCRSTQERKKKVRPLTLYNMEGSPYCRKVREVLTELDLEHLVRNVPKGSPKRADLQKRGGKIQVPSLIDPNTTEEMYESDDIVAYLEAEYGD